MWNSITQFFQSLFASSPKSSAVSDMAGWADRNDFTYTKPSTSQLHKDFDHLVFFQQGNSHQTTAMMQHRTPDLSTLVGTVHLEHEGTPAKYVCYLFENTTISLPKLNFAHRESAMFATLRGSKLSPISIPSALSQTHSGLSDQAKWGDKVFKDSEIQGVLTGIPATSLRWIETDDCHVLVVCQEFHPQMVSIGKLLFHHFAKYRFDKK